MRLTLLALLLLLNALLYGFAQGWLGTTPADAGRDPTRLLQERNAPALHVLPPQP